MFKTATKPATKPTTNAVINRMANAIRRIREERGGCTDADLKRENFTTADIKAYGEIARDVAVQRSAR